MVQRTGASSKREFDYLLNPSGTVNVVSTTDPSDWGAMSEEDAVQAFSEGTHRPMTAMEREKALDIQMFRASRDVAGDQPVQAALERGASALTFGLSDRLAGILGGSGGEQERMMRQMRAQENPVAAGVGTVGGTLASLALPFGALGKLGKAGEAAGQAFARGGRAALTGEAGASAAAAARAETAALSGALGAERIGAGAQGFLRTTGLGAEEIVRASGAAAKAAAKILRPERLAGFVGKEGLIGAGIGAQSEMSRQALAGEDWSAGKIGKAAGIGAAVGLPLAMAGAGLAKVAKGAKDLYLSKKGVDLLLRDGVRHQLSTWNKISEGLASELSQTETKLAAARQGATAAKQAADDLKNRVYAGLGSLRAPGEALPGELFYGVSPAKMPRSVEVLEDARAMVAPGVSPWEIPAHRLPRVVADVKTPNWGPRIKAAVDETKLWLRDMWLHKGPLPFPRAEQYEKLLKGNIDEAVEKILSTQVGAARVGKTAEALEKTAVELAEKQTSLQASAAEAARRAAEHQGVVNSVEKDMFAQAGKALVSSLGGRSSRVAELVGLGYGVMNESIVAGGAAWLIAQVAAKAVAAGLETELGRTIAFGLGSGLTKLAVATGRGLKRGAPLVLSQQEADKAAADVALLNPTSMMNNALQGYMESGIPLAAAQALAAAEAAQAELLKKNLKPGMDATKRARAAKLLSVLSNPHAIADRIKNGMMTPEDMEYVSKTMPKLWTAIRDAAVKRLGSGERIDPKMRSMLERIAGRQTQRTMTIQNHAFSTGGQDKRAAPSKLGTDRAMTATQALQKGPGGE